jgi:hypothetical protein
VNKDEKVVAVKKQEILNADLEPAKNTLRDIMNNKPQAAEKRSPRRIAGKPIFLSEKEIAHHYSIMKDPLLSADLSDAVSKKLMAKCWLTLGHLMKICYLKNDYDIIYSGHLKSHPPKLTMDKRTEAECLQDAETITKLLIRCEKMYDAKHEIVRILTKLHQREQQM